MKRFLASIAVVSALCFATQAQDAVPDNYDDGIARKVEVKVDASYNNGGRSDIVEGYGLTEYEESFSASLGLGYNFTSNWYGGLATGYWYHWGGESNNMIPLLGDVVYRHKFGPQQKWSFFVEGRAGYLWGLLSDRTWYKSLRDYQFSDHLYFDIQPGLYYSLRRNVDVRLSLGYGITKPIHNYERKYLTYLEDENGELEKDFIYQQTEHVFSLRVGFNFRGRPRTPERFTSIDEEIAYYSQQAEEVQAKADRAVQRAERAADRVARQQADFERKIAKTLEKERDQRLFAIIVDADQWASHDAKLQELAAWAKAHPKARIVLKSYIEDDGSAVKFVSQARQRTKYIHNLLVRDYGIRSRQIRREVYEVTSKTARENDITRRVDIYVKE